ncbi:hypothetical protein TI39_contig1089g00001 [Zymoseptoria brevis]|uniref:J domain-containing protein n=1 Tax=Zymoseptoria brevis TaxID=1047168 RepID=A0A0F4GHP6_9PEZI|nr:hypothetical protein TI39_contig1089g00001 [Zymoseptoria brevis]
MDFYTILSLPQSKRNGQCISGPELRQAYKRALLRYHPDKAGSKQAGYRYENEKEAPTIDLITEAVRVLSDPELKKAYDLSLLASSGSNVKPDKASIVQTRHTGLETLDLEDLDFDEKTEEELEGSVEVGELVVGCQGCSLWVRVLFGVEG